MCSSDLVDSEIADDNVRIPDGKLNVGPFSETGAVKCRLSLLESSNNRIVRVLVLLLPHTMNSFDYSAIESAEHGYTIPHQCIFRHFLRPVGDRENLTRKAQLFHNTVVCEVET